MCTQRVSARVRRLQSPPLCAAVVLVKPQPLGSGQRRARSARQTRHARAHQAECAIASRLIHFTLLR